jgi:hypothetical protein
MKRPGENSVRRLFRAPPKTLLDDWDPELDAPARGPLFTPTVLRVLMAVFVVFAMLCMDWIGLLLLNAEAVVPSIGPLNALRVTAVLMTGVAVPSALLMAHYRRVYSYVSDENIFFAICFFLSFTLGFPSALVGLFG